MPKHEAIMPYTPLGKETMKSHKAGFGVNIAPISQINDPFDTCDPIGFPRIDLFNLRGLQIVQTKNQVLMLYQNTRTWRNIWTDGRALPKQITEPRWFGYSVGKWVDQTTLVVTTNGLDDSTWIDNTGRPHSDELVRGRNLPPRGRTQHRAHGDDYRPDDVYETVGAAQQIPSGDEFTGFRYSGDDLLSLAAGPI